MWYDNSIELPIRYKQRKLIPSFKSFTCKTLVKFNNNKNSIKFFDMILSHNILFNKDSHSNILVIKISLYLDSKPFY